MKKYLLLLPLLFCLIFPTNSFAHSIGQPPYFKVNGIFTDYYPVPTSSLAEFSLPQDIVKDPILVNQQVEFEIDESVLPVPKEVVEKTTFLWEFGDGTQAKGLKNSHTYLKPGTYFIDIKADSGQGFEPQLLQTTAINIVSDKNYQLPKSVIEINGKQSKDPLLDIIDVNFSKEIKFESKSTGGSSEISEIIWDLGDQSSKTERLFTHKYQENPYTVFPVLRIKTKDGFIADSYIQIKDENAFTETPVIGVNGFDWKIIFASVLMSLILSALLTWVISKFLFKKH